MYRWTNYIIGLKYSLKVALRSNYNISVALFASTNLTMTDMSTKLSLTILY